MRPAVPRLRRLQSARPAEIVPTARARKPPIITAAEGDVVAASALIPSRSGSYPGSSAPATTEATAKISRPMQAITARTGHAPSLRNDRVVGAGTGWGGGYLWLGAIRVAG